MDSRKTVLMNLFSGQQWRNRHREQTYRLGGGEEGEGELRGESNLETYITICKADSRICCISQETQKGSSVTI